MLALGFCVLALGFSTLYVSIFVEYDTLDTRPGDGAGDGDNGYPGDRKGHRADQSFFGPPDVVAANAHLAPTRKKHGGRRIKSSTPEPVQWTHPDAQGIADKLPLKSWRRWLGLQEGFESWFWVA